MISIKCVNIAPEHEFDWDDYPNGWIIAKPSDSGAKKFVAICTQCETKNIVWMKEPPIRTRSRGVPNTLRVPLAPGSVFIPMK